MIVLAWDLRPDVLAVVLALAAAYLRGWLRLRRRRPDAARAPELAAYATGLVTILLALLSPIDALASRLLAAHMVQHELLTMVAPPLLLLGGPYTVMLWALPAGLRRRVGALVTGDTAVRRGLRALTFMPLALGAYLIVLWSWHLPVAYQAALRVEALHDLQHLSFVTGALLFWWPIVNPAPRLWRLPHALRMVYLLAAVTLTMLPAMVIGLFVGWVLYPDYASAPRLWGLAPLDDQALGWGLMAVFDTLVYLTAFSTLFLRLALREERMTRLGDSIDARRDAAEVDAAPPS